MDESIGIDQRHPTKHWHTLDDGRVQCDVCPRDCKLNEGQRGLCYVRGRVDNRVVLSTYGRASGFCIDPIERKPLHHFFPGTSVFSFGTAGCNLACQFCRNWDASQAREMDRRMDEASPENIARAARAHGCKSVAFSYNDPVVFLEYAIDTADACHDRGLKAVALSAAYLRDAPRREFYARMDAANIELKGFSEDFYARVTGGHLQAVLDSLAYIRHETDCWLEITTPLIPGHNDSEAEIAGLTRWVAAELGPDVPLHFRAFQPEWKMRHLAPTPPAALAKARRIALDAGLRYVYTATESDPAGGTTHCPACHHATIVRDGGDIRHCDLTPAGACPQCGASIAGRFGRYGKPFGPQHIPVFMQIKP